MSNDILELYRRSLELALEEVIYKSKSPCNQVGASVIESVYLKEFDRFYKLGKINRIPIVRVSSIDKISRSCTVSLFDPETGNEIQFSDLLK